ncbi:MAG: serine/threonine-protein phosphatase [Planctomycetia bacterium]|nr:serine/threonine-protein phosphatase [Planctomycetia bacterium]
MSCAAARSRSTRPAGRGTPPPAALSRAKIEWPWSGRGTASWWRPARRVGTSAASGTGPLLGVGTIRHPPECRHTSRLSPLSPAEAYRPPGGPPLESADSSRVRRFPSGNGRASIPGAGTTGHVPQGSSVGRKGTTLDYCDRSDIGLRRSNNQDSRAVLPPAGPQQFRTRGWLFLVADGMGAHAAGEMASAIAAERVPLIYEKNAQRSPPLALRRSIEQANGEIHLKGESSPEFRGMGTTCTVLAILPRGALVGHIGDSRVYRIRDWTIDQLSRDHSLVWELESAGGLSREQAAGAAPKNIITRSMGPHAEVDVDLEGPFGVQDGDVFVLCSDGLSGQVSDEEIGLFATELSPRDATAALVGLALVRGAPDNVTVIVLKAGAEEVSKASSEDEPWPLSDEAGRTRSTDYPWRWFLMAAAALLTALLCNPWNDLTRQRCEDNPVVRAVCLVGSGLAAIVFLASLMWAYLGFLMPDGGGGRLLRAGAKLGRGPYRSYDCTPSWRLIDGVIVSLESAADGLAAARRDRTIGILADARRHAAEGRFHEAVTAAAEAIGIYARAVEESRTDDTGHTSSAGESM